MDHKNINYDIFYYNSIINDAESEKNLTPVEENNTNISIIFLLKILEHVFIEILFYQVLLNLDKNDFMTLINVSSTDPVYAFGSVEKLIEIYKFLLLKIFNIGSNKKKILYYIINYILLFDFIDYKNKVKKSLYSFRKGELYIHTLLKKLDNDKYVDFANYDFENDYNYIYKLVKKNYPAIKKFVYTRDKLNIYIPDSNEYNLKHDLKIIISSDKRKRINSIIEIINKNIISIKKFKIFHSSKYYDALYRIIEKTQPLIFKSSNESEFVFYLYRYSFELYTKMLNIQEYINLKESFIKLIGTKNISLEDALNKYNLFCTKILKNINKTKSEKYIIDNLLIISYIFINTIIESVLDIKINHGSRLLLNY